jgi:L-fuconolactonase
VPVTGVEVEPILEPELPIVDAHHHLWLIPEPALSHMEVHGSALARALVPAFRKRSRYFLDEFLADVRSGHNIRASIFVEALAMYRASGPPHTRSVGEVEFANGVAAMAGSGLFGSERICAGIVGNVDLRLGAAVAEVLEAHVRAGGARYRGIRCSGSLYDEDEHIVSPSAAVKQLLLDRTFREGFNELAPLGLSFDALLLEPQLPDLIDLARAFPATRIVLNHLGVPVGVGRYAGERAARFPIWADSIRTLATCENVSVKLSGLGLPFAQFGSFMATAPVSSQQLANEWWPYIETCIEAFGVHRCMFASNFPVDSTVGGYAVLWNAFKRMVAGASAAEKTALFSGTATTVYAL